MKQRITNLIAIMLVGLGFCLNANAAGLPSPNKSVAEKVIAAPDPSPQLSSDTLIANPTLTADYTALANITDQPATQVNIDNTAVIVTTAKYVTPRRLEANTGPTRASQTGLIAASFADTAHRANTANISAATAPG